VEKLLKIIEIVNQQRVAMKAQKLLSDIKNRYLLLLHFKGILKSSLALVMLD